MPGVKTLTIIRHAKSSWSDQSINDHDRRLNERGRQDAYVMGEQLANNHVNLGTVFCSTARRAVKTLKRLSRKYPIDEAQIQFYEELYLADLDELINFINHLPDQYASATLIAHNPGLTELVNYLTAEGMTNLPTMGVYIAELQIEQWAQLEQGCGRRIAYFYPKLFAQPEAS
jgi:phosphohistidine phosphatase